MASQPMSQPAKQPVSQSMDQKVQDNLLDWLKLGNKHNEVWCRPSAQDCPNTFVYIWNKNLPTNISGVIQIALDVHYEDTQIVGKKIK